MGYVYVGKPTSRCPRCAWPVSKVREENGERFRECDACWTKWKMEGRKNEHKEKQGP